MNSAYELLECWVKVNDHVLTCCMRGYAKCGAYLEAYGTMKPLAAFLGRQDFIGTCPCNVYCRVTDENDFARFEGASNLSLLARYEKWGSELQHRSHQSKIRDLKL